MKTFERGKKGWKVIDLLKSSHHIQADQLQSQLGSEKKNVLSANLVFIKMCSILEKCYPYPGHLSLAATIVNYLLDFSGFQRNQEQSLPSASFFIKKTSEAVGI